MKPELLGFISVDAILRTSMREKDCNSLALLGTRYCVVVVALNALEPKQCRDHRARYQLLPALVQQLLRQAVAKAATAARETIMV
jgi:hypothetical protein